MRRTFVTSISVIACSLMLAANALGTPLLYPEDAVAGNVLPMDGPGAGPTEAELIEHALSMPAVVIAMSAMQGSGFTRQTAWDHANASHDTSAVAIGYALPGYANVGGAVIVLTWTGLSGTTTKVFYGAYTSDPVTHELSDAPVLNTLSSVDIADMYSTSSANYTVGGHVLKFMEYAWCVLGSCMTCARPCAFTGPGAPICTTVCCLAATVMCALTVW